MFRRPSELQDHIRPTRGFLRYRWLLAPFCAALFILGTDYGRIRQIAAVTAIGQEAPAAGGNRHTLIIPGDSSRGYQWLAETEQMLATGEARIRSITYENAPHGRAVPSASPYRWWLGALAWLDQRVHGHPLTQAVEQAAVWSGPLLHLGFLALGTWLVAVRFGGAVAAVFSIGVAGLYPLGGEFLPGVPADHGVATVCAWASALMMLGGLERGQHSAFVASGIIGGIGLWLDAAVQLPVLLGLTVGGVGLTVFRRGGVTKQMPETLPPLPWSAWALAGASTSLLAYLVEYFPRHLELRLQANHPVYGLGWLGLGALLTLGESWRTGQLRRKGRTAVFILIATGGLAALPIGLHFAETPAVLGASVEGQRLTQVLHGPVAANLARWLTSEGSVLPKAAVLLSGLLLITAFLTWRARGTPPATKAIIVMLAGLLVVALAIACGQLRGWSLVQLILLTLFATTVRPLRLRTAGLLAVALAPGVIELTRTARARDGGELTRLEAESLVQRDLAQWIAERSAAPGPVVLAAPALAPGLHFFGGLRGLGSPNWENREGVTATARILSATSSDEAQGLMQQRGVAYVVLASWDPELDKLVRLAAPNPADAFLTAIRRWALPPWIQPQSYTMPEIAGLEGEQVVVLKITGDTEPALALARFADYVLETHDAALAAATMEALRAYPANLMVLTARARLEKARGDTAAFAQTTTTLRQSVASGLDRLLPWDRRLSLAVVLVQAEQPAAARTQVQRCVAELTEARIRSLDPGAVYRLLVLSRSLDVPIPQPGLRELMLSFLPTEARARL